jgi:hypothetical protein
VTYWLIGAALLAVAALSIFTAFRSPTFIASLIAIAGDAVWAAISPFVLKRMSPEDEAKWRQKKLEGRGDIRGDR